ncbi:MAG: DUF3373 family protein [Deltaproteobacteria bacterium]|nr:DUF3373 family protein [Deltaproteobacteria bacterium]
MKGIQFIVAALVISGFCLLQTAVAADEGSITREEFMKVVSELKKLNREMQAQNQERAEEKATLLERIKTLEDKQQASQDADIGELQEEVEELSDLMNMVEKKTMLDRVAIGAELRTRADWFDYKDDVTNHEEEVHALVSNRFRLNLTADVSERLKFHGRLTMYRLWNDDRYDRFPITSGYNRSRTPTDSDLKVERAYIDYLFKFHDDFPMALTFGRLPQADGYPTDLRENRIRQSIYPALAFEAVGDGVSLGVGLESLTGLPDAALRFVLIRIMEDNEETLYRKPDFETDEMNIWMAQFETGLKGVLKNTQFISHLLYVPKMTTVNLEAAGLVPVEIPKDQGSMLKLTFHLQSHRFLGSNIDWFGTFSYIKTDAERSASWRAGPFVLPPMGLNRDASERDSSGSAFYLGLRYNIPWKVLRGAKFGLEYNNGSKYWTGFNFGSEDPLRKLNTRGRVWDLYYLQPLEKNFSVRIGYTRQKGRYSGTAQGLGQPRRMDEEVTNTYILMDACF